MKDLIKNPELVVPYDVKTEKDSVKAKIYDPLKISYEQRVNESLPEGTRAKVDRYGFNSEPAQDIMGISEFMTIQAERLLAMRVQIEKRDVTKNSREVHFRKKNDEKKAASDIQKIKIRERRDELVTEGLKRGEVVVELMEEFDLSQSRIYKIIQK